jgi:hypothetical protein
MPEPKTCAHPGCDCQVDENTEYCSEYCEDASTTSDASCQCGHAGCTTNAGQPTMTGRP